MIKAVTFDLWETLISHTPENDANIERLRYERMTKILYPNKRQISFEEFKSIYRRSWQKYEEIWITNQELSTEQQVRIFVDLLFNGQAPEISPDRLKSLSRAYVEPVLAFPPDLYPDVLPALAMLKKAKLKLGLICNTGRTPGTTLRNILFDRGALDFFAVTTFSDEFKLRKPEPKVFKFTCKQLQVKPEETIHVGDRLTTDIEGALKAGLQAIHLDRDNLGTDSEQWLRIKSLAELVTVIFDKLGQ